MRQVINYLANFHAATDVTVFATARGAEVEVQKLVGGEWMTQETRRFDGIGACERANAYAKRRV